MRRWPVLLLLAALAPSTWLRTPAMPENHQQVLSMTALPLPDRALLKQHLGPFELEGIWHLQSPNTDFGGWSALVTLGEGQMLAFSDLGYLMRFSVPGTPQRQPLLRETYPHESMLSSNRDCESATRDPFSGTIWLGWEGRNAITRHGANLEQQASIRPPAMRRWNGNLGPEAMVRLQDGRFIVLQEGFTGSSETLRHRALLFSDDPTDGKPPKAFTFEGVDEFSPTDMAQLPDGRVLVLMRRAVWPFPFRFAARIVIADPAQIVAGGVWRARQVASLTSNLPVDNMEGIAVEPRGDGRVTVWVISDDNKAVTQRTLLWKLAVDPSRL